MESVVEEKISVEVVARLLVEERLTEGKSLGEQIGASFGEILGLDKQREDNGDSTALRDNLDLEIGLIRELYKISGERGVTLDREEIAQAMDIRARERGVPLKVETD